MYNCKKVLYELFGEYQVKGSGQIARFNCDCKFSWSGKPHLWLVALISIIPSSMKQGKHCYDKGRKKPTIPLTMFIKTSHCMTHISKEIDLGFFYNIKQKL